MGSMTTCLRPQQQQALFVHGWVGAYISFTFTFWPSRLRNEPGSNSGKGEEAEAFRHRQSRRGLVEGEEEGIIVSQKQRKILARS